MNLAEVDFRPYVSYKADNIILLQIVIIHTGVVSCCILFPK